ncbi:AAA family ATPase [Devosia sp.]|uniref:AAA family ATPase n=1 Tax=Devosia sp. TaxID=1871048 RepID=UPI002FC6B39D
MAYISTEQVLLSAKRLADLHVFFGFAFLGFKKAGIPVGKSIPLTYRYIHIEILEEYFRLLPDVDKFFSPFASSNPSNPWVSNRYASTTLQRVVKDTFGDAFVHAGKSTWGWREQYVKILADLMRSNRSARIPVADLAVWLYRDRVIDLGKRPARQLEVWFQSEFNFSEEEYEQLCSSDRFDRQIDLAEEPYDESTVLNTFGWPDLARPNDGAVLDSMELRNVGPVRDVPYEPSSRLNLIVGDNSVGKTFILDTAWWALTGVWADFPAEPKDGNHRRSSEIEYTLKSGEALARPNLALYDPSEGGWKKRQDEIEGFAFYARHDGSYEIWDTLRSTSAKWRSAPNVLTFSKTSVWDGLVATDSTGRRRHVCNGLIVDLVDWYAQGSESFQGQLFSRALKIIAAGTEISGLGPPTKIASDSRAIPTLRMPYGRVPIVYASAGTQRALSIAYLLVWAWTEHAQSAEGVNRRPFSTPVVLLDELEAHLHPKWQRQILPALVRMLEGFGAGVLAQIHVATHSPLVLASVEPMANDHDSIHHLFLDDSEVRLRSMTFERQGTVDAWLMSDFFDMDSARSKAAEDVIEAAKSLQIQGSDAPRRDVLRVHQRLREVLPDDDEFWIRWNFFRRSFE